MIARKDRQGNQPRPETVLQYQARSSSFTIVAYLSPGETLKTMLPCRVVKAHIPHIRYYVRLLFGVIEFNHADVGTPVDPGPWAGIRLLQCLDETRISIATNITWQSKCASYLSAVQSSMAAQTSTSCPALTKCNHVSRQSASCRMGHSPLKRM